jgi:hypothetical protein
MMTSIYTAEEFLGIITTLGFEKFEDGCDLIGPIRVIRHFGWFKGYYFLEPDGILYRREDRGWSEAWGWTEWARDVSGFGRGVVRFLH